MGKRKIKAPPVLRFCAPYQRFARRVWQAYKVERVNQDTVEEARRVAPSSNISPTGPDLANLQDPQQSDLLTTQARLLQGCEQRPGLANLQDSVRSGLSNITQTIETKQVLFNFCEEDDGIDVIPEPNAEPVVVPGKHGQQKHVTQGALLGKMTRLISKRWSELPEEQKLLYKEESRKEKERYMVMLYKVLNDNHITPPPARATPELTIKLLFTEIYQLYRVRRDIFGSSDIELVLERKCRESFQYEHEVMRVNQIDKMNRAAQFMSQHPRFLQNMHFPDLHLRNLGLMQPRLNTPGNIMQPRPDSNNFVKPFSVKEERASPCHVSPGPGHNNENIPPPYNQGSPVQGNGSQLPLPISPPLTPKIVKLSGYESYKPLGINNYPRLPQFIPSQFLQRFPLPLIPPAYFNTGPLTAPTFNTLYGRDPGLPNNTGIMYQAPRISISCPLPPVMTQTSNHTSPPFSPPFSQPIPFPSTTSTPETTQDSDGSDMESDTDDINITLLRTPDTASPINNPYSASPSVASNPYAAQPNTQYNLATRYNPLVQPSPYNQAERTDIDRYNQAERTDIDRYNQDENKEKERYMGYEIEEKERVNDVIADRYNMLPDTSDSSNASTEFNLEMPAQHDNQEPVLENPSVTLLTTNSPVPTVSLQSSQSYSNPRNEPQSPEGYNSSYPSRVIPQPEYSGYPSVAVQGVPDKGPQGFSGYPSYITLGRPDITLGDSKLNQIF